MDTKVLVGRNSGFEVKLLLITSMFNRDTLTTGLILAMTIESITGMYFSSVSCGQNICVAGDIVREVEVVSEISCALECLQEEECLSNNYMRQEGSDKTICQMVTLTPDIYGKNVFGCLNGIKIGFKVSD